MDFKKAYSDLKSKILKLSEENHELRQENKSLKEENYRLQIQHDPQEYNKPVPLEKQSVLEDQLRSSPDGQEGARLWTRPGHRDNSETREAKTIIEDIIRLGEACIFPP